MILWLFSYIFSEVGIVTPFFFSDEYCFQEKICVENTACIGFFFLLTLSFFPPPLSTVSNIWYRATQTMDKIACLMIGLPSRNWQ